MRKLKLSRRVSVHHLRHPTLLAIEVHHERVHPYQHGRHEITVHYVPQDQRVGLLIYPDEFRLRLDFNHKRDCLADQTLNSEMDIVNLDHLDPHHRIHLDLIVVQVILHAMPLIGLKMHLTNLTTGFLDRPNDLACWIGMKDLLAGSMKQERHMTREDTMIVSLDQNVNHDLSEILVMKGTTLGQEETTQDPKGLKDLKDQRELIGITTGLHLIMPIAQNVPRGRQGETIHNLRAGETRLHLVGM